MGFHFKRCVFSRVAATGETNRVFVFPQKFNFEIHPLLDIKFFLEKFIDFSDLVLSRILNGAYFEVSEFIRKNFKPYWPFTP